MAFVLAPIACGSLDEIDYSAALSMPSVFGYIDHRDLAPGVKFKGMFPGQESLVFPIDKVSG